MTQIAEIPVRQITVSTHIVLVDYRLSIEELIACGRYGDVNLHVTSRQFPAEEHLCERFVTLQLLVPGREASPDEVDEMLAAEGLRNGSARELLTLGVLHPELQLGMNIVALGATFKSDRGHHYALELEFAFGMRKVSFVWPHHNREMWDANVAFLCVKKD
ncbi:MAG: hypothetical protein V1656_00460 [Candidatus Jorgensenbacteria bacterium]